jgi:low affinity Fe/Cu permease
LWGLWHLPLLFLVGNPMSEYPFLWFIIIVTNAFIYTWIYNSTKGSILLVALFHGSLNIFGAFIVGVSPIAYALLNCVVAIVLIAVLGKVNLSHRESRRSSKRSNNQNGFSKFARIASDVVGSPKTFIGAGTIVLIWGMSGPIFKFSDTWQLVINTSTTIITFLMVFIIQNTQNRDAQTMQLKLDELIYTISQARNNLVDIEDRSDEEIEVLKAEFKNIGDNNNVEERS